MLNVKQCAFLAAYSKVGVISEAAAAAGVGRRTHYEWLKDAEYAATFEEAEQEAIETLEAEARRRAVDGALEPVIYQGRLCYDVCRDKDSGQIIRNDEGDPILSETPLVIPKKSDNLLMFLLKAKRPDTYRDNVKVEHAGELQLVTERLTAARKRLQSPDEE